MTPQVSYFIPDSLEDTDKYIEVTYGHHVTAKQKWQVQIKMCNNDGDTFIATLHNILLAPDLCNRLFTMFRITNLGYSCLFCKGFCTVYFSNKEKNVITLPHRAQKKHTFLVKIKQMSKSNQIAPRRKIALELLHHRFRHRYIRSFMAGDTANFWKDNGL